jgi:hypothetical protein
MPQVAAFSDRIGEGIKVDFGREVRVGGAFLSLCRPTFLTNLKKHGIIEPYLACKANDLCHDVPFRLFARCDVIDLFCSVPSHTTASHGQATFAFPRFYADDKPLRGSRATPLRKQ